MLNILDTLYDMLAEAEAAYKSGFQNELNLINERVCDVLDTMTLEELEAFEDDYRYRRFRDLRFVIN